MNAKNDWSKSIIINTAINEQRKHLYAKNDIANIYCKHLNKIKQLKNCIKS